MSMGDEERRDVDPHEIRGGAARRWLEASFLRTRAGAQLLSLLMSSAAAYSGYLLLAELTQVTARYDPALRISEIRVSRKMKAHDVIDVLSALFITRGVPEHIRSDNGPEFIAVAVQRWIRVGTQSAPEGDDGRECDG